VSVSSPPRPPRPSDPVTHGEFDALVEALIEEARQRARRRRRKYGAASLLVAAVGVAAFIGFGGRGGGAGNAALSRARGAQSPAASEQPTPLAALPPGAGTPRAFAFDPRRPLTVYVLTTANFVATNSESKRHDWPQYIARIYKTTDGGAHWRATATRGIGWVGDGPSLVADPRHPGTLYAGTQVAVYKTLDGGRSWRPFNKDLFPAKPRICDGQDPALAKPLTCRNFPAGTPGTPHWNRGNGWVTTLAVDPAHTNVVYAGADAVRRSTDGGRSWRVVFRYDPRGYRWYDHVSALAVARTRPEAIYAIASAFNGRTSRDAIYKSIDAGRTWHATGGPGTGLENPSWDGSLAVDPEHPTTVYASVGSTLLRTSDGGASWEPLTQRLAPRGQTMVISALTVNPQRSETVYASLYFPFDANPTAGGIFKSTNGGDTWTRTFSGVGTALAVDTVRPTTIFAALGGRRDRLARSTDGGHTWATAP
jgi:photosystem II stability/assembly factor-like uncharacterized protein